MTTPTLHDDRIDKMRLSVMHQVEQDVRRRGRRLRNTVGLTAASVLVVGLGGYALSSVDTSSNDSAGAGAGEPSMVQRSEAGSDDSAGGSGGGSGVAPDDIRPTDSRQVITTGRVSVTVKDPRGAAQSLSSWIETIGGRVDNRNERGEGVTASARVTVRVPSDQVTATIERLKGYGTVEDVSLDNEDVTSQAKDLDARIDALRLSIGRLERIMSRADTSSQLIKAENALTKRQEQLESLEAQRAGIQDQVSLSTLSIDLSQKARVDSVDPGGFSGGLRGGWNALVSTVDAVVEVAGALLPWAAILALVYGGYRLVTRRRHTA